MTKKKKGLFQRMLEFQAKPLKILLREATKGVKEGLIDCPYAKVYPPPFDYAFWCKLRKDHDYVTRRIICQNWNCPKKDAE